MMELKMVHFIGEIIYFMITHGMAAGMAIVLQINIYLRISEKHVSQIQSKMWHKYNVKMWEKLPMAKLKYASHPVGQKTGNKFGLYDVFGNVWEVCWDMMAP